MARRHAVVFVTLIAFGAMLALSLLMANGVVAAPASSAAEAGLSSDANVRLNQQTSLASDELIAAFAPPVNCTLSITTTNDGLGNTSFGSAATLANYSSLALAPGNQGAVVPTEDDYFMRPNTVPGFYYTVEARPNGSGNYNLGMIVYDSAFRAVLTDTETLDGESARLTLIAQNVGPYYFHVFQIPATTCTGGTYSLIPSQPTTATPTSSLTPSLTPTPSPTINITALPGADRFEPNFNFDFATTLGLNVEYTNLNFVPWAGADPNSRDDDWFRVWIKPGILVTCDTYDLAPGVDTNMIMFDNNRNGIGGNDDTDRNDADFGSRLAYYATYEGYLYIDVGQPFAVRPAEVHNYTYSIRCITGTGPTPTPSNTSPPVTPPPTRTPIIPTDTPIPTPTFTPTPTPPFIQVRPLPTATPLGQTLYTIPILLTVYYDRNDNRTPDPGEGVAGISARVLDVTSGVELQHAFTDDFGFASLTVTATDVVRLVVPYLNHSVVVQRSGYSVALRIPPYNIPDAIP